jgi:cytochrome b561
MRQTITEWAESYRSRGKYTPVGVTFHWVMAALVLYQLWSGWVMQRELVGGAKLEFYSRHTELGLLLLLLAFLRFVWRMMVPGPINDGDKMGWKTTVAHAMHWALYTLFAVLPLTGWLMWSAIQPPSPLYLAGVIALPPIPLHDLSVEWQWWVMDASLTVHVLGTIALTVLVIGHAGAAIKHHFWDRDDVLEGMLPEVPDTQWHPAGPRYNPQAAQAHPVPADG